MSASGCDVAGKSGSIDAIDRELELARRLSTASQRFRCRSCSPIHINTLHKHSIQVTNHHFTQALSSRRLIVATAVFSIAVPIAIARLKLLRKDAQFIQTVRLVVDRRHRELAQQSGAQLGVKAHRARHGWRVQLLESGDEPPLLLHGIVGEVERRGRHHKRCARSQSVGRDATRAVRATPYVAARGAGD
jgi:hypothetical protein